MTYHPMTYLDRAIDKMLERIEQLERELRLSNIKIARPQSDISGIDKVIGRSV